jgi:hypothetical protein
MMCKERLSSALLYVLTNYFLFSSLYDQTGISLQFSFSGQSIPNRENIKVSKLLSVCSSNCVRNIVILWYTLPYPTLYMVYMYICDVCV